MIDIHSHIIPNVDDGAKNIDITLDMLRLARESGTKKLVLTPHYFLGRFEVNREKIEKIAIRLKELLIKENIDLEIYVGQEVYFTKYIIEQLQSGEIATINNSKYLLIEFNMNSIDKEALEIIHEMKIQGIVPVIAHPERYVEFQKKPSLINQYMEMGCLFQLNANSLSGLLGRESEKLAKMYLKENLYSFLGSDAHGNGRRNTNIQQYKSIIEGINCDFIKQSTENGIKLLNNQDIKNCGNKIKREKKKLFGLF